MDNENNFIRMKDRMIYYIKKHRSRFCMQLVISLVVSIVLMGQLGQSMVHIFSDKPISFNPLILLYYALIQLLPVTIGLFLLINLLIMFVMTNMEKKNYDAERNFQISETGTKGTGGFMKEEDKRNALYMKTIEETDGFILGRDTDTDLILSPKETLFLNGHKCVCGGSGARKTTTQALNDLFQIIKNEWSFITTDPKGEIYGMLATMCERRGYDVKKYDLVDLVASDAVDFVKACRDDYGNQDVEVKNVMTLVNVIMSNTSNENEAGFWKDLQTGLLTAAILYVMYDKTGRTKPTLSDAYDLILKTDPKALDQLFNNLDNSHPAKAQYLVYAKSEDKVRNSVVVGLMMRLQILQTNAAKRIISEDEIDLTAPGKHKCAYFIIMSDQERTFDFLSSLFFSMFFIKEVAYADSMPNQKTKVPVYIVMDEFPSIGTLPDFSRKLATLRSRQILITIIFQNLGQIMDKYEKHEWQTIVSNCDYNVYLGGNDAEETAKFYTNILGEMTAISKGKRREEKLLSPTDNRFHPTTMITESETNRAVLTVDEFRRLDTNNAIVILKSCRPLLVRKFVYTEHPYSKQIIKRNTRNHVPHWRRVTEGYPEDFTDEELYPLIKRVAESGKLVEYLNAHKIDPTYNFVNFLEDNDEEAYNIFYDIYREKTGPYVARNEAGENGSKGDNGNTGNNSNSNGYDGNGNNNTVGDGANGKLGSNSNGSYGSPNTANANTSNQSGNMGNAGMNNQNQQTGGNGFTSLVDAMASRNRGAGAGTSTTGTGSNRSNPAASAANGNTGNTGNGVTNPVYGNVSSNSGNNAGNGANGVNNGSNGSGANGVVTFNDFGNFSSPAASGSSSPSGSTVSPSNGSGGAGGLETIGMQRRPRKGKITLSKIGVNQIPGSTEAEETKKATGNVNAGNINGSVDSIHGNITGSDDGSANAPGNPNNIGDIENAGTGSTGNVGSNGSAGNTSNPLPPFTGNGIQTLRTAGQHTPGKPGKPGKTGATGLTENTKNVPGVDTADTTANTTTGISGVADTIGKENTADATNTANMEPTTAETATGNTGMIHEGDVKDGSNESDPSDWMSNADNTPTGPEEADQSAGSNESNVPNLGSLGIPSFVMPEATGMMDEDDVDVSTSYEDTFEPLDPMEDSFHADDFSGGDDTSDQKENDFFPDDLDDEMEESEWRLQEAVVNLDDLNANNGMDGIKEEAKQDDEHGVDSKADSKEESMDLLNRREDQNGSRNENTTNATAMAAATMNSMNATNTMNTINVMNTHDTPGISGSGSEGNGEKGNKGSNEEGKSGDLEQEPLKGTAKDSMDSAKSAKESFVEPSKKDTTGNSTAGTDVSKGVNGQKPSSKPNRSKKSRNAANAEVLANIFKELAHTDGKDRSSQHASSQHSETQEGNREETEYKDMSLEILDGPAVEEVMEESEAAAGKTEPEEEFHFSNLDQRIDPFLFSILGINTDKDSNKANTVDDTANGITDNTTDATTGGENGSEHGSHDMNGSSSGNTDTLEDTPASSPYQDLDKGNKDETIQSDDSSSNLSEVQTGSDTGSNAGSMRDSDSTSRTVVLDVIAGLTDTQASIQADTQENTVAAEPAVPTMQNEENAEMEVPMESGCSNTEQPEEQERTSGKGQKEEQAEEKAEEKAESGRKESPSVIPTSIDMTGVSPEPIVQAPTPKKRPSLRPVFSIDAANGNMASMNGSHGSQEEIKKTEVPQDTPMVSPEEKGEQTKQAGKEEVESGSRKLSPLPSGAGHPDLSEAAGSRSGTEFEGKAGNGSPAAMNATNTVNTRNAENTMRTENVINAGNETPAAGETRNDSKNTDDSNNSSSPRLTPFLNGQFKASSDITSQIGMKRRKADGKNKGLSKIDRTNF